MGRIVSAGAVIASQLDFFISAGSISRVVGIPVANLSLKVFFNNALLSWTLADGTLVSDSSISAGTVYFNEVSGSSGYYSLRTFFDRVGFWRLIVVNASLSVETIIEYDVLPAGAFSSGSGGGGLIASFTKSC